ncbi:MAG: hypothetical protein GC185_08220 [Alphaproteobacteria bacterium]|nr:hypothetical protein [Alphaproteobacteria bacterium]
MRKAISAYSGGYYKVRIDVDGILVPHMVRARSGAHAALLVHGSTGVLAPPNNIEGPYFSLPRA